MADIPSQSLFNHGLEGHEAKMMDLKLAFRMTTTGEWIGCHLCKKSVDNVESVSLKRSSSGNAFMICNLCEQSLKEQLQ
jgi:hypothetical protein